MHRMGDNDFRLDFFSQYQTISQGNPLFEKKIKMKKTLLWKIFFHRRVRGITIFCPNCFISQYRNISKMNISVFQKVSGSEKTYASEGDITILCRKFFYLLAPEGFLGEHFCVSECFCYRKRSWIRGWVWGGREGVSRLSVKILLSNGAEKFCLGAV